jgi:3-oxoacyl-[acyl-carrier protein] reductase
MNPFSEQVAIVTGGTKGIGRATAEQLLTLGARVVICARTEAGVSRSVAEMQKLFSGKVAGISCDVSQFEQVVKLVKFAVDRFSKITILINNAGVGHFDSIAEMTPMQWREVIDTNLSGVFYCCHEAIPYMKKAGGGYIINISSLAGKNPFKGGTAYNASKFGLNGFSEAMMQDVRYDNIRVSYIMPGSVDTEFGHNPSTGSSWKLSAADVAQVVVDLLKHDPRCLPSCVEMRPSKPPKK